MVWYLRFDTVWLQIAIYFLTCHLQELGGVKPWFFTVCGDPEKGNFTLPRSSKSRKKDSLATSISTWISCYPRNWGNHGKHSWLDWISFFKRRIHQKTLTTSMSWYSWSVFLASDFVKISDQSFELVSGKAMRKHLNVIQVSFREDSTDPKHPRATGRWKGHGTKCHMS